MQEQPNRDSKTEEKINNFPTKSKKIKISIKEIDKALQEPDTWIDEDLLNYSLKGVKALKIF